MNLTSTMMVNAISMMAPVKSMKAPGNVSMVESYMMA